MEYLSPLSSDISGHVNGLMWVVLLIALAIVVSFQQQIFIYLLGSVSVVRLIFSVGPEPTLWLLGSANVSCRNSNFKCLTKCVIICM